MIDEKMSNCLDRQTFIVPQENYGKKSMSEFAGVQRNC